MRINVANSVPRSAANGPGDRYVVWVQGCPLSCPGCWNPDMWDERDRDVRDSDELIADIMATGGIEGVTFTGGEPFMQAEALAVVAEAVRFAGLSVFVFTGFEPIELDSPDHKRLLASSDVVVSGRYLEARRTHSLLWRGSENQQVRFLTSRYGLGDLSDAAEMEFHLGLDGALVVTGFPTEGMMIF